MENERAPYHASFRDTGIVNKDEEHLRLLKIFHYIVGAVTGLYCSFPLIHVFLGLMFVLSPGSFQSHGEAPPPQFLTR